MSTGVHDLLHTTAAVLDDGERIVAVVSIDSLPVKSSLVAEARAQIRQACGILPEDVLITATHTHTGGPVADVFESEADPDYYAFVARNFER
ncbi:hypothetical protein Q2T83_02535 [Fervidibacter sacchari]|uniref:Neutral ceramidase superfamily lipid hydrolase n=1 Tax=Candidatus Fervidibacter sacchari TaxID=1448929 RepID=A0ABT2EQ28_9BACT|nr:hypothetical protein [Candidatus Fervidibacter sacchari]MCS3920059.1 putative neutral ceramidase superfamily lipid hydrolase [Candidatus Fervidibacter sacchari]WKU16710.1 hypothetical protein Q2T83_02535 [Candidatus Fervidibacter sacchari]